jgi:hypothetical protein
VNVPELELFAPLHFPVLAGSPASKSLLTATDVQLHLCSIAHPTFTPYKWIKPHRLPVNPRGTPPGERMPEADGSVDEQKARFGSHLRTFCENCTADA